MMIPTPMRLSLTVIQLPTTVPVRDTIGVAIPIVVGVVRTRSRFRHEAPLSLTAIMKHDEGGSRDGQGDGNPG